jgi:hypothetical protein
MSPITSADEPPDRPGRLSIGWEDTMDLVVRRLGPEDAAAFQALRLEGLERHPCAFAASHDEEVGHSLAEVAGRLERQPVFGAFDGADLIGVAGFAIPPPAKKRHKGLLWGVYVREAARSPARPRPGASRHRARPGPRRAAARRGRHDQPPGAPAVPQPGLFDLRPGTPRPRLQRPLLRPGAHGPDAQPRALKQRMPVSVCSWGALISLAPSLASTTTVIARGRHGPAGCCPSAAYRASVPRYDRPDPAETLATRRSPRRRSSRTSASRDRLWRLARALRAATTASSRLGMVSVTMFGGPCFIRLRLGSVRRRFLGRARMLYPSLERGIKVIHYLDHEIEYPCRIREY